MYVAGALRAGLSLAHARSGAPCPRQSAAVRRLSVFHSLKRSFPMGISTPVRVSWEARGRAGRWTRRLFKPLLSLALVAAASAAFGAAPARMKIGTTVWIAYGPFSLAPTLHPY